MHAIYGPCHVQLSSTAAEVASVQVLKHLTIKRPLEAIRTDFFAQVRNRCPDVDPAAALAQCMAPDCGGNVTPADGMNLQTRTACRWQSFALRMGLDNQCTCFGKSKLGVQGTAGMPALVRAQHGFCCVKRILEGPETDALPSVPASVQAEAFATLVLIDFVTIGGAAQTIMTLLKKPDNRCAAITMLGKTIELCHEQVRRVLTSHVPRRAWRDH